MLVRKFNRQRDANGSEQRDNCKLRDWANTPAVRGVFWHICAAFSDMYQAKMRGANF